MTPHGDPTRWLAFEADEGRRTRDEKARRLLGDLRRTDGGQPFAFEGALHGPADRLLPRRPPAQRPHPPVWVVGVYFVDKERRRSLKGPWRWNGLLPQIAENGEHATKTPELLAEAVDIVRKLRAEEGLSMEGFDVVVEGDTFGGWVESGALVADWKAAGATWWVESWWNVERGPDGLAEVRRRIAAGPPA